MKIAVLHPDLGIGGAERLVVDASVGLQKKGHNVTVYTSHCDKSHCFEEVKDGTLKVIVSGNTVIPTHIFGRFAILCAVLRQIHLVINLLLSGEKYDVFLIDQLSAGVPLLRLFNQKVLFYCHFPDQLLALPGGWLKKLYRIPFDAFEDWSTGLSDVIVVNSKFTRSMFKKTFRIATTPEVIYPCVDTDVSFENCRDETILNAIGSKSVLLSVNRFERKKDIGLAIDAYNKSPTAKETGAILMLAGGYDHRVTENVNYLKELEEKCDSFGLKHTTIWPNDEFKIHDDTTRVVFLPSVSTNVKNTLLNFAKLLLYTPQNEHFGIVPLEAMLASTPVLATNTGGPLETVVEGETGWNRPAKSLEWAGVIEEALKLTPERRAQIGIRGVKRVKQEFSFEKMSEEFDHYARKAANTKVYCLLAAQLGSISYLSMPDDLCSLFLNTTASSDINISYCPNMENQNKNRDAFYKAILDSTDKAPFLQFPLSLAETRHFWRQYRSKLVLLYLKYCKSIDRLSEDLCFQQDLQLFVDIYKVETRLGSDIWPNINMSKAAIIHETVDGMRPPPKNPRRMNSMKSMSVLGEVSTNDLNLRPRTPKKNKKRESVSTVYEYRRLSSVTSLSSHNNTPFLSTTATRQPSNYSYDESSTAHEIPSSVYSFESSEPTIREEQSQSQSRPPIPPPKSVKRVHSIHSIRPLPPVPNCNNNSSEETLAYSPLPMERSRDDSDAALNKKNQDSLRSKPKYVRRFISTPNLRSKITVKRPSKEIKVMEPTSTSKPILKSPQKRPTVEFSPSTIGFAHENEVFRFDENHVIGKSLVGWSTTKMAKPAKTSNISKFKRLFSLSSSRRNEEPRAKISFHADNYSTDKSPATIHTVPVNDVI